MEYEKAYEAYLEYVVWRYANPNATVNDELMAQWRIASAARLTPVDKYAFGAFCWQFDKHGAKATAEADRSEFRVDV